MARTYVVTGAASGVGAATVARLRTMDMKVIGVDLQDVEVIGDLSTPEGRLAAAKSAIELAGGKIDSVIACAGISVPTPKALAVNYFGVVEFLDAIRPALLESVSPRVAVVSSMASLQPVLAEVVEACLAGDEALALRIAQESKVGFLSYSSSKRALSRWVRRVSILPEWAGAGIPVNAVGPGTILTPMTAELLGTPEGREMVDKSVPMPLNYHQSPEVIADLLIWLTSEQNTHCAGQTIYCDGGADATLRGDDIWSWNDPKLG